MNIRDTNWLLFSSNKKDCWKTLNYDESCVLAGDSFTGNILDSYYRIFKDSNGRWVLEEAETTSS
ncbi:MAG: hypothetical protein LBQ24_03540 [Candidatus Peribacteria bacterium]|jgi:hypothetical protein|nr:hypothetical protein [Candidatus Peribacteria bacterium]